MKSSERIKFHYKIIDDRVNDRPFPLLSVSARHGIIPRETIADGPARAEDFANYKVCHPGDIVINRMSAYQGAVGRSPLAGMVSPDYMVVRPAKTFDSRYAHHLFRSTWFVGEMTSRLRGIGSSDNGVVRTPRINPEDLGDIPVSLPTLDDQRRIAAFLDAKTALVDQLVELRRRQAELVETRFSQLVDGALLGDSESLAEIRCTSNVSEWSATKVSRSCLLIPGYAFPSDAFVRDGEGVRLVRGINVSPGYIDWSAETMAWDVTLSPIDRRFHLAAGDLVIGMDRTWISGGARVAFVTKRDLPALLLQRVACLRPRTTTVVMPYVRWSLASGHFRKALEADATGVSVPHISGDQISSYSFLAPPPDQQRFIAEKLDEHDRLRREYREQIDRQVSLLFERRQALITAAVTGQLDVTTARGVDTSGVAV